MDSLRYCVHNKRFYDILSRFVIMIIQIRLIISVTISSTRIVEL